MPSPEATRHRIIPILRRFFLNSPRLSDGLRLDFSSSSRG